VGEAVKYLKEVKAKRARNQHTPYCLIVSLVNPHDVLSYLQNASLYGYHGNEWAGREIGLPNSVDEKLLRNKKPMAQAQALAVQTAGLGALTTDDDKLNYINFYGYLLSKVDKEISYITDELYTTDENGAKLADTAVVIQTSDHGEMGLAHGGLRQKMFVSYEEALRVPLVISNPLLFKNQQHKNSFKLATLVDLMPTIAEIATVPTPPSGLRGVSLVPVMENNTTVQDSILFAYDDTKAGLNNQPSMVKAANRVRCIRTEEWKYDYYFHALFSYAHQYQMYNLLDDPGEVTNLAYDPKCTTEREKLKKQLHELEREKLLVHDLVGAVV